MKLDVLAFAAHPDDIELSCSGILMVEIARGKKVGIIDLTEGELGTRGNKKIRRKEAKIAQKIMGVHFRENLCMKDGFFANDKTHQLAIIQLIRACKPSIVLCNAPHDRHPDHGRASTLVRDAFFLSGLSKIKTQYKGKAQKAWRPFHLMHYLQDQHIIPNFYVDITPFWGKKKQAILAYASQFYTASSPQSKESETYISSSYFMESLEARYRTHGKQIGVMYAEGLLTEKSLGVTNLSFLIDTPF